MTKEEWKLKLLEYCEKDWVSFAELTRRFEEARGNWSLEMSSFSNVLIWTGLSPELTEAIVELLAEEKIHYAPASLSTYLAHGSIPRLPVAKPNGLKRGGYTKLHWLPLYIRLGPYEKPVKSKQLAL